MPANLDTVLTESLHRRADTGTPIDPALLLDAAVSRGRRRRRSRRLAVAGSAFVATAAVTLGLAAMPDGPDRTAPVPTVGSQPATSGPAEGGLRMPAAPGQPGALTRPDLVGTDPSVLHFSIDTALGAVTSATWISAPEMENVQFFGTGPASTSVSVARRKAAFGGERSGTDPKAVVVNGRTGTLVTTVAGKRQTLVVTWSPVAGLWARVSAFGTTRDEALRTAEAVRFDRATRCVVPLRLTAIPAGMAVQQCSVTLDADGLQEAALQVGDGRRYARFSAAGGLSPQFKPTLKVGPHRVLHTQDTWMFVDGPYVLTLSTAVGGGGPIPQSAARTLVAGSRTVGAPDDPATW